MRTGSIGIVLSGAAGFAAMHEYEEHLRKQGQPVTHEKMKASHSGSMSESFIECSDIFVVLAIISYVTAAAHARNGLRACRNSSQDLPPPKSTDSPRPKVATGGTSTSSRRRASTHGTRHTHSLTSATGKATLATSSQTPSRASIRTRTTVARRMARMRAVHLGTAGCLLVTHRRLALAMVVDTRPRTQVGTNRAGISRVGISRVVISREAMVEAMVEVTRAVTDVLVTSFLHVSVY